MGSKRNKLRKALSPPQTGTPPPTTNADDDELMNDLMAQLDSRDQTVQLESATVLNEMELSKQATQIESSRKQDAKSRFRARQDRKAAAMAQNISPDNPEADARLRLEAEFEENTINRLCNELDVRMHEINPDGHCLFSAVADQLALLSILTPSQAHYSTTRLAASNYIWTHPEDFLPFLPSASGEDGIGATNPGFMAPKEFERYCVDIRDTGVWGGEPEILALSRAYNVPIHVVQSGIPPVVVHNPSGEPMEEDVRDKRAVRISYHRKMYGLGEHYNSLRPRSGLSSIANSVQDMLFR